MQSPKMTSLVSLFLVIAITTRIVAAAPTFAEAVDDNVENFERGLTDTEQQENVAEQVAQEGAVAKPHCARVCIRWDKGWICIEWKWTCSRSFNDAEAESANVQDSEVEQQANVAESGVDPVGLVQDGVVAKPHCWKVCIRWDKFSICIEWKWKCSRSFNDAEAESANVQGSEADDKVYRSLNEEQMNVAEQEVQQGVQDAVVQSEPEVQDAVVVPNRNCNRICIRKNRIGLCILWRHICKNSRSFEEASLNVQE